MALAFHATCLLLWIAHGACYHYVVKRSAPPLPSLLAAASPLALAISLGRFLFPHVAGFWASAAAVAACLLAVFVAYSLNAKIARWSFLTDKAPPDAPTPPTEAGSDGSPATVWQELPNGLRYRSDCVGEIGMGGPPVFVHYFSNGIELGDGDLRISADGRYAVCNDARHASRFVLADLERGRLRSQFSESERRAIEADFRRPERLANFLRGRHCEQLIEVCGLWLPADMELPPEHRFLRDPRGRERLHLERRIDAALLAAADEPRRALREADYAVILDGVELPVLTRAPDDLVWAADGELLLIPRASRHAEVAAPGTHWLWRRDGDGGWVSPRTWDSNASLPSGGCHGVSAIDGDGYWLDFYMNRPNHDAYPQRRLGGAFPDSYTCGGPYTWVAGADERGRLLIRDFDDGTEEDSAAEETATARLRVRLPWTGDATTGVVESAAAGGSVARFHPTPRAGDSGLLRYRVEAGAASADDVALYHLWSDCGRYLALQPHCQEGAAADRFFVLDTRSGAQLASDFRGYCLQLIAWREDELQVAVAIGCVDDIRYSFDPFAAAVAPSPPPTADGRLLQQWLLSENLRFRVDSASGQLRGPLAKFVELDEPPYPNAAFDFYYHAPDRRRSVFVFGARNEYQDNYDRAQCCRYQARAIISDGICLAGLGVAMIWSDDARYLLVIERVSPDHPAYDDLAWHARLLDCEERLIYPPVALGCMPIFERFAGRRIDYRQVPVDWWRPDVDTRLARLDLDTLRRPPPQPLLAREGLWLAPGTDWDPQWLTAHARAFGDRPTGAR